MQENRILVGSPQYVKFIPPSSIVKEILKFENELKPDSSELETTKIEFLQEENEAS